ncbi:Lsr2 protein [Microbacterium testaceum StLB037]|uniref:Lsr2 protein n=1 Tax=Microbacterium testaceum (strain StLB037) TaxID=979556 RepID=A0A1H0P2R5_MICTS|nr:Lsr2 family protein [Microbacterium testaceum]SDO98950.1 Lsr2 protein [Microbacterium testaceum StLB037]
MAKEEIKTYIYRDDLTGEIVEEDDFQTVEFSYGGDHYTIDLGVNSAKKLDDFLAPYIDKASKAYTRYYGSPKSPTPKAGKSRPGARAWAEEQGHVQKGGRGRLSNDVLAKYDEAHA